MVKDVEGYFDSFPEGLLEFCHMPGHAVDFGNLEADFHAKMVIKEYRMQTVNLELYVR